MMDWNGLDSFFTATRNPVFVSKAALKGKKEKQKKKNPTIKSALNTIFEYWKGYFISN